MTDWMATRLMETSLENPDTAGAAVDGGVRQTVQNHCMTCAISIVRNSLASVPNAVVIQLRDNESLCFVPGLDQDESPVQNSN